MFGLVKFRYSEKAEPFVLSDGAARGFYALHVMVENIKISH